MPFLAFWKTPPRPACSAETLQRGGARRAGGLIGSYRKVHLPYFGIAESTTHGDRPFAVHDAGGIKVGMNICYDALLPEGSRAMAILGAHLIALPTNWPPGSGVYRRQRDQSRAIKNAVYFIAVNRVGTEHGFEFIGRSKIADPGGNTLAESHSLGEEILYAEIDPVKSRRKHINCRARYPASTRSIAWPTGCLAEMYGLLSHPHHLSLPRPAPRGQASGGS